MYAMFFIQVFNHFHMNPFLSCSLKMFHDAFHILLKHHWEIEFPFMISSQWTPTPSEAIGSLSCRCNSSSGSMLIERLTEL